MAKIKTPTFKILRYPYKTLSNGENPVMVRVTFDRKQKYFSLGMSAAEDAWNDALGRFDRGKGKRLTDLQKDNNLLLDRYDAKLKKAKQHFEEVEFSFARFDKLFFQATHSSSVFKFTEQLIGDLVEDDRIGSAFTYKYTLSRLKAFRNDKDFSFRDIDLDFIEAFVKHLRPTNTVNSIGIYLRTLKAVYNRAVKKGLVKEDLSPWKGFRIETEATRKRALTRDQINALKEYKPEPGSSQWHSLNLFLFSYYMRGMNFEDIARLTHDDIRNDRIFYNRKKTGDALDIVMDNRISEIVAHYLVDDNYYIFPILSPGLSPMTIKHRIKKLLKSVNKDLQDIAAMINAKPENKLCDFSLPEDITFYWGRHSAATALKRAGVSTAMISEILGHSSEAVTKTYLDSFEKNQLDEIGKHL